MVRVGYDHQARPGGAQPEDLPQLSLCPQDQLGMTTPEAKPLQKSRHLDRRRGGQSVGLVSGDRAGRRGLDTTEQIIEGDRRGHGSDRRGRGHAAKRSSWSTQSSMPALKTARSGRDARSALIANVTTPA